MNADAIVSILIGEADAASAFVQSMPDEFWDTFHVIHDRDHNVHADEGYRDHELVYKNNSDGTRDFIGYLVQASNYKFYPAGVKNLKRGRVDKLDWKAMTSLGEESLQAASKHLMKIYREVNR